MKDLWRIIIRRGEDMKENNGGRMKMEEFHFVMVLVGLLEASMAGKREQDYYLPIDWKLCWRSTFFYSIFFHSPFLLLQLQNEIKIFDGIIPSSFLNLSRKYIFSSIDFLLMKN